MAKSNEPIRPVIVKKVYEAPHGGHHGGAWKVAYADFVTAMMAFFLLMWLLGATTEKQRKALADYFSPTLVSSKQDSAGSTSFFGGDSITSVDKYPHRAGQTGTRSMTIPRDATGGPKEASGIGQDRAKFQEARKSILNKLQERKEIRRVAKSLRFTETRDGLRIDMVDEANFSMFISGTDILTPDAIRLLNDVGGTLAELPNGLIVRGHTDAQPTSSRLGVNNWQLSSARAEATRAALARAGITPNRFVRIEGVADREPYVRENPYDPRNRRMSITLGWRTIAE
ncbi:flagellar motor protein MotB [Sphingorhabdus lacus]|jgi:chemotaxis protein MotB|uniref:Flagellar motor protein MotB n=1 Tax=Sphingorhabdus lacus TaxID=392610 RepID=A0A6I6LB62_9SPHN|nr:flagellar motor protein MotB [Sphingorhabdus lacus]